MQRTFRNFLNYDLARGRRFTPEALARIRTAEGFYHPKLGTVIIAENVVLRPGETPQDALTRVILHERVGHNGLKALLGAKDGQGRELWEELKVSILPAELDAIANDPAYRHLRGDPDALAQEWFARKAESSPHLLEKPGPLRDLWNHFKGLLQNLRDHRNGSTTPQIDQQLRDLLRQARKAALQPPPRFRNRRRGSRSRHFSIHRSRLSLQPPTQGAARHGCTCPSTGIWQLSGSKSAVCSCRPRGLQAVPSNQANSQQHRQRRVGTQAHGWQKLSSQGWWRRILGRWA